MMRMQHAYVGYVVYFKRKKEVLLVNVVTETIHRIRGENGAHGL